MGREEGERVGRTREFIFVPRFSPYSSHLLCQLVEDGSSEGFMDQPASDNWLTEKSKLKGAQS
jgi:hypothetical protein